MLRVYNNYIKTICFPQEEYNGRNKTKGSGENKPYP